MESTNPTSAPDHPAAYRGCRVLVAGGFGFLGAHLCRHLVAAGAASVVALDRDTSAARAARLTSLPRSSDRFDAIELDVMDRDSLRTLLARGRFDHVFHFAAFSSVIERAAREPAESLAVNSMGVVHILEALRANGGPHPHVVLASTDKVYGDHGGRPYGEASELRARGVYESSKLAGELFAHAYRDAYDLPVSTLRLCNVFGPCDVGGLGFRIVPRSLAALFRDPVGRPQLYATSRAHRRDYIHVDDCCRAFLAVGAHDPRSLAEPVFNLAGTANVTTLAMLEAVLEAAARTLEDRGETQRATRIRAAGIEQVPPPDDHARAIPEQRLDGTRLREATGFTPSIRLEDGLAHTAAAYYDWFAAEAPGPAAPSS